MENINLPENGNYKVLQPDDGTSLVNINGEVYPVGADVYLTPTQAIKAIGLGLVGIPEIEITSEEVVEEEVVEEEVVEEEVVEEAPKKRSKKADPVVDAEQ